MNNELYHHGIKGMHWGVRRFQNYDGTLTAEGKQRERDSDRDARREANRKRNWAAKNSSQLSDKELTDQILRLQREKQLKDLTSQVVSPGRKRVKDLLIRSGEMAATTIITAAVTSKITDAIRKESPEKMYEKTYNREWAKRRAKEDVDRKAAESGYRSNNYNSDGSIKDNSSSNQNGKKKNK